MSIQPASSGLSAWLSTPLGAHLSKPNCVISIRKLADCSYSTRSSSGCREFDSLPRQPHAAIVGYRNERGRTAAVGLCRCLPVVAVADLVVLPHALSSATIPSGAALSFTHLMPEGRGPVRISILEPVAVVRPWRIGGKASNRVRQFINLPDQRLDGAARLSNSRAGACACYAPQWPSEKWFPVRLRWKSGGPLVAVRPAESNSCTASSRAGHRIITAEMEVRGGKRKKHWLRYRTRPTGTTTRWGQRAPITWPATPQPPDERCGRRLHDGACKGNPGLGGWFWLKWAIPRKEIVRRRARDTTTVMELTAVIEGAAHR